MQELAADLEQLQAVRETRRLQEEKLALHKLQKSFEVIQEQDALLVDNKRKVGHSNPCALLLPYPCW